MGVKIGDKAYFTDYVDFCIVPYNAVIAVGYSPYGDVRTIGDDGCLYDFTEEEFEKLPRTKEDALDEFMKLRREYKDRGWYTFDGVEYEYYDLDDSDFCTVEDAYRKREECKEKFGDLIDVKVGDKVYTVDERNIHERTVVNKYEENGYLKWTLENGITFDLSCIGIVFTTPEYAERKRRIYAEVDERGRIEREERENEDECESWFCY